MPDSPEDLIGELNGPGTGSEEALSQELAGDLLNLPFQVWGVFSPAVVPLNPVELEHLSKPFSRLLEKWGAKGIATDEIMFGFYFTCSLYARIRAIKDSKPKKNVANDSGKKGEGKDNPSEKPDSGAAPGPDIHS